MLKLPSGRAIDWPQCGRFCNQRGSIAPACCDASSGSWVTPPAWLAFPAFPFALSASDDAVLDTRALDRSLIFAISHFVAALSSRKDRAFVCRHLRGS